VKPEYAHWDRQPEYVLTDAAQLCCDNEPQPWARETISPKVEAMARRIKVELTACRDTSQTFYSPSYGGGKPLPIHVPGEQFYKRVDLREWAERTGQRAAMPFLFPEDRTESAGAIGVARGLPQLGGAMPSLEASHKNAVVTVADREAIPARLIPNELHEAVMEGFEPATNSPRDSEEIAAGNGWPYSHDTRLLAAIRWVIENCWEGKDPKGAPTKETVVDKLVKPKGLSKREALAVDQVTRHDTLRSPGR
jgi:hypothetical protein